MDKINVVHEQVKDQNYDSVGNQALLKSIQTGHTIRVLRGQLPYYYYLGLYKCIGYTYGPGIHGKNVFKFTLVPIMENPTQAVRVVPLRSKFSTMVTTAAAAPRKQQEKQQQQQVSSSSATTTKSQQHGEKRKKKKQSKTIASTKNIFPDSCNNNNNLMNGTTSQPQQERKRKSFNTSTSTTTSRQRLGAIMKRKKF